MHLLWFPETKEQVHMDQYLLRKLLFWATNLGMSSVCLSILDATCFCLSASTQLPLDRAICEHLYSFFIAPQRNRSCLDLINSAWGWPESRPLWALCVRVFMLTYVYKRGNCQIYWMSILSHPSSCYTWRKTHMGTRLPVASEPQLVLLVWVKGLRDSQSTTKCCEKTKKILKIHHVSCSCYPPTLMKAHGTYWLSSK